MWGGICLLCAEWVGGVIRWEWGLIGCGVACLLCGEWSGGVIRGVGINGERLMGGDGHFRMTCILFGMGVDLVTLTFSRHVVCIGLRVAQLLILFILNVILLALKHQWWLIKKIV